MDVDAAAAASSSPAASTPRAARWRLGGALWLLGMPGVVAVVWAVVPPLMAHQALLPVPLWAMVVLSGLQTALLLAGAVALGVVLSPQVGLTAPAIAAWTQSRPVLPVLGRQLAPGLGGGLAGAAGLYLLSLLAPEALRPADAGSAMPWTARLLYGGITEELLMRWGAMTVLLWLGWRVLQGGREVPRRALVAAAVVGSAVLFALGHLPAAQALAGTLTPQVIAFPPLGNMAWGLAAGALFARYGLEAAMVAHVLAHALSYPLL